MPKNLNPPPIQNPQILSIPSYTSGYWTKYDPGSYLTVTDFGTELGMRISIPSPLNTEYSTGLLINSPTPPYSFIAANKFVSNGQNWITPGIGLRNSVNRDICIFGTIPGRIDHRILCGRLTVTSGGVATYRNTIYISAQDNSLIHSIRWFRIRDNGSTIYFDYSGDGYFWYNPNGLTGSTSSASVARSSALFNGVAHNQIGLLSDAIGGTFSGDTTSNPTVGATNFDVRWVHWQVLNTAAFNGGPFYTTSLITTNLLFNSDPYDYNSYTGKGLYNYDISPYGHLGTLSSYPSWTQGYFTYASASSQYIDFGSSIPLNATYSNLTIGFWIKAAQPASESFILGKMGGAGQRGFQISLTTSYKVNLTYFNSASGASGSLDTTSSMSNSVWTYVAFTFSANGSVIAYVNGVANGSTSALSALNANNTASLRLGDRGDGAATRLTGSLGAVHIYNSTLSASDIVTNYNALKSRYGIA